ncbi:MAG: hypothetical protein L0387_10275 [Acidobacteria bacterium]|nr:hypothetical protein [Acidobacteriota bacterium]MCI0717992.1 hypothetical protein [Acidobacteriota bacterium]
MQIKHGIGFSRGSKSRTNGNLPSLQVRPAESGRFFLLFSAEADALETATTFGVAPGVPDSLYFFVLSFSLLKDPNEVPPAGRLEIARNDVAEVSKPIVPIPIVVPAATIKIRWARHLKQTPFVGIVNLGHWLAF